jgi:hypothetical protein
MPQTIKDEYLMNLNSSIKIKKIRLFSTLK